MAEHEKSARAEASKDTELGRDMESSTLLSAPEIINKDIIKIIRGICFNKNITPTPPQFLFENVPFNNLTNWAFRK